jgi:hypothetical protein
LPKLGSISTDTQVEFVSEQDKSRWDSKVDGNDPRLTDSRPPATHSHNEYAAVDHNHNLIYAPLVHSHNYEPANANIQTHIASAHAPSNAQRNADITKAEIEAKLIGPITSHTHPGASASTVVLGNDVVNNNAVANTIADIVGLSFPVVSGQRYTFRFLVIYNSAATTTGSRWSVNGPSTTQLNYRSEYTLTITSRTINEGLTGYNTPAASNASSLTVGNIAIIEGVIVPSASGTVIARFASEVAGSAVTCKAGSYVTYQAV